MTPGDGESRQQAEVGGIGVAAGLTCHPEMIMVTALRAINRELARRGDRVLLANGGGRYDFYFRPGDAAEWVDSIGQIATQLVEEARFGPRCLTDAPISFISEVPNGARRGRTVCAMVPVLGDGLRLPRQQYSRYVARGWAMDSHSRTLHNGVDRIVELQGKAH